MPTENRSSNTEMVSVPREPSAQMLDAARNAPVPMVYVDSMRARQDLEFSARYKAAISQCTQLAPTTHPDPIAWMVGTAFWWTKEEAKRDAAATGLPLVGLGPLYSYPAPANSAEVERAPECFCVEHGLHIETLRAQLAEAHALLREIASIPGDSINYHATHMSRIARAALSASAEPSALPDPLGCNECTHAECGRFDGPRQVECRAMADNACARPGASS